MPQIGDHYRSGSASDERSEGPVYRVVGASDDVALLRITDGDGRRVHAGEVRRVPADDFEAEFEPATNPDAGFAPVRALRNALSGMYWEFRRFL